MANKKQKITIPGIGEIDPDWATEETMESILKILEKKYGKSGKGGSADKEQKKQAEAIKFNSKLVSKSSEELKKRAAQNKKMFNERVDQLKKFIRSNKHASEALDIVGDTGKLASREFNNLNDRMKSFGSKTVKVVDTIDSLDGSVSSANSAFLQLVGGAGMFGAAMGFAAGVVDEFIEFQTSAIQRGFSFSRSLVDTRSEIAGVGLRMRQLAEIINMNGEALGYLASNGRDATHTFIGMLDSYKQSTIQFGFFGDTTEEMALQLIEQVDVLRRSGMDRNQVEAQAVKNLQELNRETFAMSQITARDRRELMRERLDATKDNALLIHNLNQLGPAGTKSFEAFKTGFAAVFGTDTPLTEMFVKMLETNFADGQMKLSPDQLAVMNGFVPGLGDKLQESLDLFLSEAGGDGLSMEELITPISELATLLDGQKVDIANMIELIGSDTGIGEIMLGLLHSVNESQTFLSKNLDEVREAFNREMPAVEAGGLMLKERFQMLQNEINAAILRMFQFDKLEDLANDVNYEAAIENVRAMGDAFEKFGEFIFNLPNLFSENGSVMDELVIGAGLFFAARSAFTLAMIAGAQATWALVNSKIGKKGMAATAVAWAASMLMGGGARHATEEGYAAVADARETAQALAKEGDFEGAATTMKEANDAAGGTVLMPSNGLFSTSPIEPKYWENWAKENTNDFSTPRFEDLDFFEQQEMRMNTPGSRGAMDALRASGAPFDAVAHAVVTGRYQGSSPEELTAYLERLANAMEENNRLMRHQTNAIVEQ